MKPSLLCVVMLALLAGCMAQRKDSSSKWAQLIKKGESLLRFVNKRGYLHKADLEKFLKGGSKINFAKVDDNGWNIFHHYIRSGGDEDFNVDKLRVMLSKAKQEMPPDEFKTMLNAKITATMDESYLADNSHLEVGDTLVHAVIKSSRRTDEAVSIKRLHMLAEYGADFNLKNASGKTALYDAIEQGDLDMVRVLFGNDFKINIDEAGPMPLLHLAVKKGSWNMFWHMHDIEKLPLTILNDSGDTLAKHAEKLINDHNDKITKFEKIKETVEVKELDELFKQGKLPFHPSEYYSFVTRRSETERIRAYLQRTATP